MLAALSVSLSAGFYYQTNFDDVLAIARPFAQKQGMPPPHPLTQTQQTDQTARLRLHLGPIRQQHGQGPRRLLGGDVPRPARPQPPPRLLPEHHEPPRLSRRGQAPRLLRQ